MKIAKILWSKYSAKKDFRGVFRILLNICGGPFLELFLWVQTSVFSIKGYKKIELFQFCHLKIVKKSYSKTCTDSSHL